MSSKMHIISIIVFNFIYIPKMHWDCIEVIDFIQIMWILETDIIFMIEINNMCTSFSFIKHLNYYIVCRGEKINGIISAFTMFTIYYGDNRIYQYDIKIASGEYCKDLLKNQKSHRNTVWAGIIRANATERIAHRLFWRTCGILSRRIGWVGAGR